MYISKFIFRTPRNLYAGALVLSPDNENIIERVGDRYFVHGNSVNNPDKEKLQSYLNIKMLIVFIDKENIKILVEKYSEDQVKVTRFDVNNVTLTFKGNADGVISSFDMADLNMQEL